MHTSTQNINQTASTRAHLPSILKLLLSLLTIITIDAHAAHSNRRRIGGNTKARQQQNYRPHTQQHTHFNVSLEALQALSLPQHLYFIQPYPPAFPCNNTPIIAPPLPYQATAFPYQPAPSECPPIAVAFYPIPFSYDNSGTSSPSYGHPGNTSEPWHYGAEQATQPQAPLHATSPVISPASPAEFSPPPQIPSRNPKQKTFNIAVLNAMAEDLYERYFPDSFSEQEKQSEIYKSHMLPFNVRKYFFKKHFCSAKNKTDAGRLSGKDFVLLQEIKSITPQHDYGNETKSLSSSLYDGDYASVGHLSERPHNIELLFDEQKYGVTKENIIRDITHNAGRYLGGIFDIKDADGNKTGLQIGVVSVHIQYKRPHQLAVLTAQIEALDYSHPNLIGWIVGGDFNIDYNTLDRGDTDGLSYMRAASFQDAGIGWCEKQNKRLTAIGKIQHPDRTGDRYPWFAQQQAIDYIWHRQGCHPHIQLQLSHTDIYPPTNRHATQLLTCGNLVQDTSGSFSNGNDRYRLSCSDHAMLLATFVATQNATPCLQEESPHHEEFRSYLQEKTLPLEVFRSYPQEVTLYPEESAFYGTSPELDGYDHIPFEPCEEPRENYRNAATAPSPQHVKTNCPDCTLLNPSHNDICSVCQAPLAPNHQAYVNALALRSRMKKTIAASTKHKPTEPEGDDEDVKALEEAILRALEIL